MSADALSITTNSLVYWPLGGGSEPLMLPHISAAFKTSLCSWFSMGDGAICLDLIDNYSFSTTGNEGRASAEVI